MLSHPVLSSGSNSLFHACFFFLSTQDAGDNEQIYDDVEQTEQPAAAGEVRVELRESERGLHCMLSCFFFGFVLFLSCRD